MRRWGFTSQMASSARHQMSLFILIWAVLGGVTSDQFPREATTSTGLTLYLLRYNITPAYTYPVVQYSSSHTSVEQVDKKTDCASSLIQFYI